MRASTFLVAAAFACTSAADTIAGTDALVSWVGRRAPAGGAMFFDWEGVSATVTVSWPLSWLTVNIVDQCGGVPGIGGGSRWGVYMTSANPNAAPAHHRIATFISGPALTDYYMYSLPGGGCDPNCNFGSNITFQLVRLTESRLSGCGPGGNLSVVSFSSDGTFITPPPPAARRIEWVGDSISAGDLNQNDGASICANGMFNNDITATHGALLAQALQADFMGTAWGGIQLGSTDPSNQRWGMQQLYPYTFSGSGTNAYAPWQHTSFPVDAVVINLGTNDRPAPPATAWQQQYVNFVTELVGATYYNNKALAVFLSYGPMTAEYQPFVTNVTATLTAAGINAHLLDLTLTHPLTGCYGHPSAADNVEIAAKATPQIATVMGW